MSGDLWVDDICTLKLVNNEVKIEGNEEIIDKARIKVLTKLFINKKSDTVWEFEIYCITSSGTFYWKRIEGSCGRHKWPSIINLKTATFLRI